MNTRKNRFLILVLPALALLFPVIPTHADDDSAATRQVIVSLFEAFNRHDTEALVALYSEDAQILSPGDLNPRVGNSVVRDIYADHFDNIPGVHDAVQNIVVEGNRGAVEFTASWDQPTEGDPDARGQLRIAAFITVRNGKIIKDITYFDRVELSENMKLGSVNQP